MANNVCDVCLTPITVSNENRGWLHAVCGRAAVDVKARREFARAMRECNAYVDPDPWVLVFA